MKQESLDVWISVLELVTILFCVFCLFMKVNLEINDSYKRGYEEGQKSTIDRIKDGCEDSDLKITE